MVTIVSLSQVRGLVCLQLDNGEQYWIPQAGLRGTSLTEGQTLEEAEFHRLVLLCQYPAALDRAVAMLARRPCSTGEIRRKLRSGRYMSDVIDLVLFKLEKEKLLNDEEFCDQWARYRLDAGYGPRRILQELKMKGIPESMAEEALMRADGEGSAEHAAVLALKTWNRMKDSEDRFKTRQKVIAALVRKGYDWDTAKSASDAAEETLDR